MILPNLPSLSQILRHGAEAGHEFARICNQLAISANRYVELHTPDDSSGDFKCLDAYYERGHESKDIVGFQYKFYPTPLTPQHRHNIKESLEGAIDALPRLVMWILVTPDDFNRFDQNWFVDLCDRFRDRVEVRDRQEITWTFNVGLYQ